jgi:hypothetical protein
VVLVIEDSEKDTFASTREQILMLKRALQKHGDRVEIVASYVKLLRSYKRWKSAVCRRGKKTLHFARYLLNLTVM